MPESDFCKSVQHRYAENTANSIKRNPWTKQNTTVQKDPFHCEIAQCFQNPSKNGKQKEQRGQCQRVIETGRSQRLMHSTDRRLDRKQKGRILMWFKIGNLCIRSFGIVIKRFADQ